MAPISNIGVIALVPDKWHGIWMPRHHVLGRLARHFEVIWIEPAAGWRDYWLPNQAKQEDGLQKAIHYFADLVAKAD